MGWIQHALGGLVVLAIAFTVGHSPEHERPSGQQVAPKPPVQSFIDYAAPIVIGEYTLRPRATFRLEARVLARERYRFDRIAGLIPIDIAFGWAEMSDTALIKKLSISQSGRFYFWSYARHAPASHDVIIRSSANMHLIPASAAVAKVLFNARVGDVVALEGELVDVAKGTYLTIATSLTREDSGPGACEIIYVRAAAIRP